jgi:hypothetical protein
MYRKFFLVLPWVLVGCAGLDTMQFKTRGFTPNAARVLSEAVVGAHLRLCTRGVASVQGSARVEPPEPQNPREYPPIFPPAMQAYTQVEVRCN